MENGGSQRSLQSLLSVVVSDSRHSDEDPDPQQVKSRIRISIESATHCRRVLRIRFRRIRTF